MTALRHDTEAGDRLRGQMEATPDAFARCIERLEEVVAAETAIIRGGGRIDYDALNQRKSYALLEFMRAARNAAPQSLSRSAERVAVLRNLLAENARLLEQRLRAAEEITNLIVRDIRERESDGTYSLRSPRAPQR